jgi:O-succinylbenzoate synthase
MRIERVELRHIRMEMVHPFETSFARETDREALIVTAYADGLTGWGESAASAAPLFSYETVETCWHVLHDFLAPAIIGQEVPDAEEFARRTSFVRGHPMAKAALEAALWDVWAQAAGQPLAEMLGGVRDQIDVGVSIGIQQTVDELLVRIHSFLEEGYRRIKIKIKPGWDLDIVRTVRAHFPDIRLQVDANSAYTLDDVPLFQALDSFDLLLIEQPLAYDDFVDHAALQRQVKTPICLDETIANVADARAALALGSCRVVNIKPGRVGGLRATRQIHDLCEQAGVPVWCGGMMETGIGRAANVAVGSLPNFTLPGDLSASARYYHEDLVDPPFMLNADGTMTVPQGPGLGVTVRRDRLDEVTLRKVLL